MIGIYCIENLVDGKKYIGQSVDVERRLGAHRCRLNGGYHANEHLQRAWRKYGEMNFSLFVVEECPEEYLDQREIDYISIYESNCGKFGYNVSGGGNKRRIVSTETRDKISKAHMGKRMSEKAIDNISKGHMGQMFTDEHKRVMSNSCSKIVWSGFVSPSGDVYENISNLGEFCRQMGLSYTGMRRIALGVEGRKTYRGWRAV